METSEAYFILNLLPGIGPLRVNQMLDCFGGPVEILQASARSLQQVPGISSRLASIISCWSEHCDPDMERELARKGGVAIVSRDDPDYPALLRQIADPPLVLYCRGNPELLAHLSPGLAMVGTRGPSNYGVKMARYLAESAVFAGWTVVSGLARGIDTVVHQAVVEAGGYTAAVLGCGLAQVYPVENQELGRRICREGLLISELPMQMKPTRLTFPMRNRLIAGMTMGTLVIEAGTRSGALITASQALEQNRRVFAVPGRVDSPQARGCHSLLKDGAGLVERFDDVNVEFDFGMPFPGVSREKQDCSSRKEAVADAFEAADGEKNMPSGLTDLETRLLELMGKEEMHIDDLIARSGEPAHLVLATLSGLEMRHVVEQIPGKKILAGKNLNRK